MNISVKAAAWGAAVLVTLAIGTVIGVSLSTVSSNGTVAVASQSSKLSNGSAGASSSNHSSPALTPPANTVPRPTATPGSPLSPQPTSAPKPTAPTAPACPTGEISFAIEGNSTASATGFSTASDYYLNAAFTVPYLITNNTNAAVKITYSLTFTSSPLPGVGPITGYSSSEENYVGFVIPAGQTKRSATGIGVGQAIGPQQLVGVSTWTLASSRFSTAYAQAGSCPPPAVVIDNNVATGSAFAITMQ